MIVPILIIALQVYFVVDVIRNRRNSIWIMAIVFLPVAGGHCLFHHREIAGAARP